MERNGRRETGLLRVGFFRRGLTLASFRELGKQPVEREVLIRWVRKGRRSGAIDWRR